MGANTETSKTYDCRAGFGKALKEGHIRGCADYKRLKRLTGPEQLGLIRDLDPSAYAGIVHGLQRFYDNHVLWDAGQDATVIRKHMAFTLFAPAGRADRARTAVDMLADMGYFDETKARGWDDEVYAVLKPRVRFWRQKTDRCGACMRMFDTMRDELPKEEGNINRRRWLMKYMPGYGPKAATHFMRNSGMMHYMDGLPIIDVHIHKALEHFSFRHSDYDEACLSFRRMAELVDVPVLILDAVLWCAYANNWELDGADFDNFGILEPLKQGTVTNGNDTGKDNDNTAGLRAAGR
jgi:thermostable 8-oxoguanine DNA glycosylase